jgi:hypothetical protein
VSGADHCRDLLLAQLRLGLFAGIGADALAPGKGERARCGALSQRGFERLDVLGIDPRMAQRFVDPA